MGSPVGKDCMLVSRAIVQGQQEGTPEERPSQQALPTRAVFVLTWLAVVWASQLFFCCLVALAGSADPPSPSVALKPDVIMSLSSQTDCVSLVPPWPLGVIHPVTFHLLSVSSWQVPAGCPGPPVFVAGCSADSLCGCPIPQSWSFWVRWLSCSAPAVVTLSLALHHPVSVYRHSDKSCLWHVSRPLEKEEGGLSGKKKARRPVWKQLI